MGNEDEKARLEQELKELLDRRGGAKAGERMLAVIREGGGVLGVYRRAISLFSAASHFSAAGVDVLVGVMEANRDRLRETVGIADAALSWRPEMVPNDLRDVCEAGIGAIRADENEGGQPGIVGDALLRLLSDARDQGLGLSVSMIQDIAQISPDPEIGCVPFEIARWTFEEKPDATFADIKVGWNKRVEKVGRYNTLQNFGEIPLGDGRRVSGGSTEEQSY